jgi:hypothetical protein
MEVTRRSVLLEALRMNEDWLRMFSKGQQGLEPKKGSEKQFEEQQQKCDVLREMIRALESEPVRKAMADWQAELMADEEKAKRDAMADLKG